MSIAIQAGATDLYFPAAEPGEILDPYTIHTHYLGLSIPESELGVFLYLRGHPALGTSLGGVVVFRGMDNRALLDAEYHDFRISMPWPAISGNVIRSANGLEITVEEPGRVLRARYTSPDSTTSLDVRQEAISPLVARGHVLPGEEDHHAVAVRPPGGIEQYMHATGELVLHGVRHEVDCLAVRDRSWCQVRGEPPGGMKRTPPIGWSPISFGEDFSLNLVSIEHPDSKPAYAGLYDVPEGAPLHYSGWLYRDGELRGIASARRSVQDYHPDQFVGIRQQLEITDDRGEVYAFTGEAVTICPVAAWPNISFHDCVFRWTDDRGRVSHGTYQDVWYDDYQRMMKARRLDGGNLR